MRHDRSVAEKLRREGESYSSIQKQLGVPKSTLSTWFSNLTWSSQVKKKVVKAENEKSRERMRVMSHKAKNQRMKRYQRRRREAQESFPKYITDSFFNTSLAVYWSEGDSKLENGNLRVTNTEPALLKVFSKFLQRYLSVSRSQIRAYLILYPDLKEEICLTYWSRRVGLSKQAFFRSHFIKGHHPSKRLRYGICTVMLANREKKEVLIQWIRLFKKHLLQGMRV